MRERAPEFPVYKFVWRGTKRSHQRLDWVTRNTSRRKWPKKSIRKQPNITRTLPNLTAPQPNIMERATTQRAKNTQQTPSNIPKMLANTVSRLTLRANNRNKVERPDANRAFFVQVLNPLGRLDRRAPLGAVIPASKLAGTSPRRTASATGKRSPMSISRTSRAGVQRPSCLRARLMLERVQCRPIYKGARPERRQAVVGNGHRRHARMPSAAPAPRRRPDSCVPRHRRDDRQARELG